MRITRRPTTTIPGVNELPAPNDAADAGAASGGPVTDRVQLSDAARLRQRLKTELGDPTVDTNDQVGVLQAAVAAGTYAPSPGAVADRLLGELAANLVA